MMYSLFSLLIGLIFGSFAMVVIKRVPKKKSLIFPGSHCPSCKKGFCGGKIFL